MFKIGDKVKISDEGKFKNTMRGGDVGKITKVDSEYIYEVTFPDGSVYNYIVDSLEEV